MAHGKKETEIEITPAMLQAGVWVIADKHGLIGEYVAEEIAEEVYRAMVMALREGIFAPPNETDSIPR